MRALVRSGWCTDTQHWNAKFYCHQARLHPCSIGGPCPPLFYWRPFRNFAFWLCHLRRSEMQRSSFDIRLNQWFPKSMDFGRNVPSLLLHEPLRSALAAVDGSAKLAYPPTLGNPTRALARHRLRCLGRDTVDKNRVPAFRYVIVFKNYLWYASAPEWLAPTPSLSATRSGCCGSVPSPLGALPLICAIIQATA